MAKQKGMQAWLFVVAAAVLGACTAADPHRVIRVLCDAVPPSSEEAVLPPDGNR